jgi:hypothetical protein
MLRGTAADAGCAATRSARRATKGTVQRVQVSVSLKAGAKCRYLTDAGRLTKPLACGTPLSVVAKGKRAWTLKVGRTLPKGRYTVKAVSIDGAGNLSKAARGTLRVG